MRDEVKSSNKANSILNEIGDYLEKNTDIIDLNNKCKKYFNKIKEN